MNTITKNDVKLIILITVTLILSIFTAAALTSEERFMEDNSLIESDEAIDEDNNIDEINEEVDVTISEYDIGKIDAFDIDRLKAITIENKTPYTMVATIDNFIEEDEVKATDTYTTVENDSYYKIAEKMLGDGRYCYALAAYNNAENNYELMVGQIIAIPDINDEEFINLYNEIQEERDNEVLSTTVITANTSNDTEDWSNIEVRNNTGEVDTSGYTYLGTKKITGYTPGCEHCCGNTNGITASGTKALPGRTIAAKGLNFGDVVYIKGYGYYVVEDRGGFSEGTIDMAAPSHEACYALTATDIECYLVPNN